MSGFLGSKKVKLSFNYVWIAMVLPLLIWYVLSLAYYLVKPPIDEFSNPVQIGTVEYGAIKNMQTAVVALKNSDDESMTILAIDGHKTSITSLDVDGIVLKKISLDLDMYDAKHIEVYKEQNGKLRVFYLDRDLHEATIDPDLDTYQEKILQKGVSKFNMAGPFLVIVKEETLSFCKIGSYDMELDKQSEPTDSELNSFWTRTTQDKMTSYAVASDGDSLYISYTTKDGRLICTVNDEAIELSSSLDVKFRRVIEDMLYNDHEIAIVFSHENKQFQENTISAIRFDMNTYEEVETFQQEFTIQKGKIDGIRMDNTTMLIILQDYLNYGVNLVRLTFESGKDAKVEPLTKSKIYSVEGNYFSGNGLEQLIFSNRPGDHRELYYATNLPKMIKETSQWVDVDSFQLWIITILVSAMSILPSIATYILKTVLAPFLLIVIVENVVKRFLINRNLLLLSATGFQLLLSVLLTLPLASSWSSVEMYPLGPSSLTFRVGLMIFFNILVMIVTQRFYQKRVHYETSVITPFAAYVLTSYAGYIFMIIVYLYTELIISKV